MTSKSPEIAPEPFTRRWRERYTRSEPEVAEALTDMFGSFIVPIGWAKWRKNCWESPEAASAVSRLNQALTE